MYIEGFLHEQTVEEGTKQSKTLGAEALPQDIKVLPHFVGILPFLTSASTDPPLRVHPCPSHCPRDLQALPWGLPTLQVPRRGANKNLQRFNVGHVALKNMSFH